MEKENHSFIDRILNKILGEELYSSVRGDLMEDYHHNKKAKGKIIASLAYSLSALGFLRYPSLFYRFRNSNNKIMLGHYIKNSFRSFRKDKLFTAITLTGLVASFATSIIILQYSAFENSYDTFHSEKHIYRASHFFTNPGGETRYASTFFAAASDIANELPEIKNSLRLTPAVGTIKLGSNIFSEDNILISGPAIFEMFDFNLLKGSTSDFENIDMVFLSESTAQKYFGADDPVGKTLTIRGIFNQNWEARVAGVYEDFPINTHLIADLIIPISKLEAIFRSGAVFGPNIPFESIRWRLLGYHTYFEVDPMANIDKVEKKANEIVDKYRKVVNAQLNQKHSIKLQPIADIHLTPGFESEISPVNNRKILLFLFIVALFILTIAWINHINFSTARAIRRAREVGIRKALGSTLTQLRVQFFTEGFLLNLMAFLFSILLIWQFSPLAERIIGIHFFDRITFNAYPMIGFLVAFFIGTLLSGFYPAIVLANYKPVEVLKNKITGSKSTRRLRSALVLVQLIFCMLLISSLYIVNKQFNFMLSYPLGITIDNSLVLESPGNSDGAPDYESRMNSLINTLNDNENVELASLSSIVPGNIVGWRGSTENAGTGAEGVFLSRAIVDERYFDLYGVEILSGRNFDPPSDADGQSIILNRMATELLGFSNVEEVIGGEVHFTGSEPYKIVGVIENFHQRGLQFPIEPLALQLDTALLGNFMTIRLKSTENLPGVERQIHTEFKTLFPEANFNVNLLSDIFNQQYAKEERLRILFGYFSVTTLIIALLGVSGLSAYLTNQKLKEFSIRKILGANNLSLFINLNKEHFLLSILAFIISGPVSLYLANEWVSTFENRVELPYFELSIPFLIMIALIVITNSRYSLKIIGMNPTQVLRNN